MASSSPPIANYAPVSRTASSRKTPLWVKILVGCLIALACVGLSVGFVLLFGSVHGTELCAETLERRTFTFLEIPLIGYQIRATTHIDVSGALEKHLATAKLVPAPPAAKKTWHLIQIVRGVTGIRKGDPEILCRYLDARNSEHDIAWLKWTEAHPQLAPHVWKGVCDLALAGEYTAIPDLLELSQGATDPVALQAEIKQLVQQAEGVAPAPKSSGSK
jgi:hypothetical protein